MPRRNINWQIYGVDIDPRVIKIQAKAAFEYEATMAAQKIANAIDEHIQKLNANSSNRGVGFLAVRYNNPFEDLHAIVEQTDDATFKIFVPSDGAGDGGYKFNVLDQGSPGSGGKPVTFPIYEGNLTSPDSLELGNVTLVKPTKWHVNKPAKGFPGRNILQTVKNEAKEIIRKPLKKSAGPLARALDILNYERGDFRYKYDPTNLKVRMTKARK